VSVGDSTSESRDNRWWRKDLTEEERYKFVIAWADRVRKNQLFRRNADYHHLRLYGNVPVTGMGQVGSGAFALPRNRRKVSYNVVQAVSDSFVADVTKDDPKASFITSGGDYELQQKARGMELFVEGQLYEMGFYRMLPLFVLDGGGIFGTGIIKFWIDGEGEDARIECERVLPFELVIDEQEALKAKPRNLMQQAWVDRPVLEEMFKDESDKLAKIRDATKHVDPHVGQYMTFGYDSMADQLLVTEAWHLRSGRSAKDGTRVMCIENCTLLEDEWVHDWFPFITYRKQAAPLGWWGIGIADQLDGLQESINSKLFRIERGLKLLGAGHILVAKGSKVDFSQWDSEQGTKIEYSGPEPKLFLPPEVVPEQMFAQLDRDYDKSFELVGQPRAQAQGEVPSNLESGRAQEVYLSVGDRRKQVAIHNLHEAVLEAAKIVVEFGRIIVEKHNPKFAAKVADGKLGLKKILLSEHLLEEDEYILQRKATNLLSDDPAARIKDVERMINTGMAAPDEAKRLFFGTQFADVKEDVSLEMASYDAVEQCIAEMLNEGRYRHPMPYLNLAQAKVQAQFAIIKAWRQGRPEDRQQLLRDWLEDLKALPNLFPETQTPAVQAGAPGTPVAAAPAPGVTPAMQGGGAPPPPQGVAA
jgi:hypothetical protein